MLTEREIENIVNSLTEEELIGQMMCFNLTDKYSNQEWEELVKKIKPGSFFVAGNTKEEIRFVTDLMNKYTKVPGMIASDIERGPGCMIEGEVALPHEMAWGACDDAALVEEAHAATAERCRELGIHWSFSPIVDINYNKDNPATNIRAISDVPEQVIKMGTAAVRGLQRDGLMVAGCKHFPGDGVDDRNQHFCTVVNDLSAEEWMDSFGRVYKEMFKTGTASVMVAHIALPAYDEKINEWLGYPPASISFNLQTRLLREKLGFEGCIVSDALSMVGAAAVVPYDRLSIEFVKAGGDILLFPLPEYVDEIKSAIAFGEITIERIKESVRRIIRMKDKARLFENQEEVLKGIAHKGNLQQLADAIGEKSIHLVRNYGEILPLQLNKGDKILIINIKKERDSSNAFYVCDLDEVETEFKNRGFEVMSYVNPRRSDYENDFEDAAVVLINCKLSSQDYAGGSLRVGWDHIAAFWRGDVLRHKKVVFTSFGCPYKLYDYPYLKTYVNAFSYSESTQRAYVKALLGEIPFEGKSPVSLEGFFKAEV